MIPADLFDEIDELPSRLVDTSESVQHSRIMNGEEVRRRLAENMFKVGDLAKILGVSTPLVSRVIHGQRKSPKVRAAISRVIGCPVRDIWPETD